MDRVRADGEYASSEGSIRSPSAQSGDNNRKIDNIRDILQRHRSNVVSVLEEEEDAQLFTDSLSSCLESIQKTVRERAVELILKVVNPTNANGFRAIPNQESSMVAFWKFTTRITISFARIILNIRDVDQLMSTLTAMEKYLNDRNVLLQSNGNLAASGVELPERTGETTGVQVALLMLLYSPNPETCSRAVKIFGSICTCVRTVENSAVIEALRNTAMSDYPVFAELASESFVVMGRVAVQKQIRARLRLLTRPSAANLAAWEGAYRRWNSLTIYLKSHRKSNSLSGRAPTQDQSTFAEWSNLTGFLAALGGSRITDFISPKLHQAGADDDLLNQFIEQAACLLTHEDVAIRETIRETFGSEFGIRVFGLIFQEMERLVRQLFNGGSANVNAANTLLVDQIIVVLRTVVERMENPLHTSINYDLGAVVMLLSKYVSNLGKDSTSIKIKACGLIETISRKKEILAFAEERKVQSLLMTILCSWMEFSTRTVDRVQKELDLMALKATEPLLYQLMLLPCDEEDSVESRRKLVKMLFTFILEILKRSSRPEDKEGKEVAMIRELTTQSLSNLVTANLESGLELVLGIGQQDDVRTRIAAMQILTRVLLQLSKEYGPRIEDLTVLNEDDRLARVIEVRYCRFTELIAVVDACPASEVDSYAEILFNIFDCEAEGLLALEVLKEIITDELEQSIEQTGILRRNSMATKMLSAFAQAHGSEYLKTVLQPIIHDLLEHSGQLNIELDPQKAGPDVDLSDNVMQLILVTQRVIDQICDSVKDFPVLLRDICAHIDLKASELHPRSATKAVGGFVFLRFICPAIVSPDSEELTKLTIGKENRRGLMLIAKVIQNLANDMLFGAKESYMEVLNDFLQENIFKINEFLRDIALPIDSEEKMIVRRTLIQGDSAVFHQYLYEHQERIRKSYMTRLLQKIQDDMDLAKIDGELQSKLRNSFSKLSNLLSGLGAPPKNTTIDSIGPTPIRHGNPTVNILTRGSNCNLDIVKSLKCLYVAGISKAKRPVILYIPRRFNPVQADFDMLYVHLFELINSFSGTQGFELFVDFTGYTMDVAIPSTWVNNTTAMISHDARNEARAIYMHNINWLYCKKIKKELRQNIFQLKITDQMIFTSTREDLERYISLNDVELSADTLALMKTPDVFYRPVVRISRMHRVNCSFALIDHHIKITTLKKQEIRLSMASYLTDVYHISTLEEIHPSHTALDDEFILRFGRVSMMFASHERGSILKTLQDAKTRYEREKSPVIPDRVWSPSISIPGLLHMSFLNMCGDDIELRLAAYDLLSALVSSFSISVDRKLLPAKGLYVPIDYTHFLPMMSTQLAMAEPSLAAEFVTEFLGINFVSPFLTALGNVLPMENHNEVYVPKLKSIIRALIEITGKETELSPLLQGRIWYPLSTVDYVVPIMLNELIQYACLYGYDSPQGGVIFRTITTIASLQVRGHVLLRLQKLLNTPSQRPIKSLSEHSSWGEMATLIMILLHTSFHDSEQSLLFLPETLHITTLLVNIGPTMIRQALHRLLVNTVQALHGAPNASDDHHARISRCLKELSEPKIEYVFGLHIHSNMEKLMDDPKFSTLETLMDVGMKVTEWAAPTIDISNVWRAKWMSMATSSAFMNNSVIQPRAFVVMGTLANEDVDDDLLYQVLVALRDSLRHFNETHDHDLLLSISSALAKMASSLSPSSRYITEMFWLAIALCRINYLPLSLHGVMLAHSCIRTLAVYGFFQRENSQIVLLRSRSTLHEAFDGMDKTMGISFSESRTFAVAVCGTVLPGLFEATTRTATLAFLKTALEVIPAQRSRKSIIDERRHVPESVFAFLILLLPMTTNVAERREILWLAGLDEMDVNDLDLPRKICARVSFSENSLVLLYLTLIWAMINARDGIGEFAEYHLFGFLAELSDTVMDTFLIIYDDIAALLRRALNYNQHTGLLSSIDFIVSSVNMARQGTDYRPKRSKWSDYLEQMHFGGLLQRNSLSNPHGQMMSNIRMTCNLIDTMTS
ncbi:Neurofibromin [Neolecta irregularis DAH-3]|uniref:Neurofibromin n=1 Tax=Neolecta irregularis (strain DAH-3) TaxID=1198029 RepID=A0A1U7LJK1_NEOID|nr:Neurofibromin [Neolecta irregularis DAH-3]|eukprot:OLL22701.1 Neurofibromin [Neolecta irregularis DAH-3]